MSWSGGAGGPTVDARGATRVNAHWRARVLISAEAFTEGRTINVSESGVSLLLDRRFPDGAVLTLALAVPDPTDRTRLHAITAQARVVFNVASGDRSASVCSSPRSLTRGASSSGAGFTS